MDRDAMDPQGPGSGSSGTLCRPAGRGAAGRAGRAFSLRGLAMALVGAGLVAAGPGGAPRAWAQDESSGLTKMLRADPNGIRPFDPRLEIRNYMQDNLPSFWWAGAPDVTVRGFSVTVHLSKGWRGNPTSAMMRLCPPPSSTIWRGLETLELRPFYHDAPWPSVVCRPY